VTTQVAEHLHEGGTIGHRWSSSRNQRV
jgi:hypothetical protein